MEYTERNSFTEEGLFETRGDASKSPYVRREKSDNVANKMKHVSFIWRIYALFIVQWHIQRRKYLQLCCLVIFPVFIMVVPVLLSLIAYSRNMWYPSANSRMVHNEYIDSYFPCQCPSSTGSDCLSQNQPSLYRLDGFTSQLLFVDKTPKGDDPVHQIDGTEKTGTGFFSHFPRYPVSFYFTDTNKCSFGPTYRQLNDSSVELMDAMHLAARSALECMLKKDGMHSSCESANFVGHGLQVNRLKTDDLLVDVDIISNNPYSGLVYLLKNILFKIKSVVGEADVLIPHSFNRNVVGLHLNEIDILQVVADSSLVLVYPIVVSFLFPLFLSSYIQDRNLGVIDFIQLFGVREWEESFVRFTTDMVVFILYSSVNLIFCIISQITIFQKAFWVIIIANIIYGYIQIHAAYALAPLFKNASQSTPIGYLLIGVLCGVGSLFNLFLFDINPLPWWAYLLPPFIYGRVLTLTIWQFSTLVYYRPSIYQLFLCFAVLLVHAAIITLCSSGIITTLPKWILRKLVQQINVWRFKRFEESKPLLSNDSISDPDVKNEETKIRNGEIDEDVILLTDDLTKSFGYGSSKKTVVNHLYLTMKRGQCFGLIGSNGSGKTTTISMITGMLKPTLGTAKVCGYDCISEVNQVKKCIGVLPQFEILWPSLTVEEHLYFYAKLRGIAYHHQGKHVREILKDIGLEEARRRLAKNLSGGMRRRLGLAIALTGSPPLLLLDEPSSGLDAASARGMWDLVLEAKKSRCVVLTSHSMHEVETLCERIGILANGNLVCIGDLIDLKKKNTDGYKLKISCDIHNIPHARNYIANSIPFADFVQDLGGGNLLFRIKSSAMQLSVLFANLQFSKLAQFGIRDWSLDQASLDEVFMKFSVGHDD